MGNTAESSICGPVYNQADIIVAGGWDIFHGYAQDAYSTALAQLAQLGDFDVPDTPLELSYAFPTTTWEFNAPLAPTRTISAFTLPNLPAEVMITPPTFDVSLVGPRPEEPTDLPTYTPPTRPNVSIPAAPDTAIQLDALSVPDAPSYVLPEVPSFISLNLPDAPSYTIPTFDATVPDIGALVAPDAELEFNEVEYSSELLEQVKTRLATMGQGGTGLPAAVEQALFDRARGREDQVAAADVATAIDEFARMGYEEPSGILYSRIERARQRAQDAAAGLSRDVYIQAQQVEIENLRFFVTQGIALEQVLIQQHMAVQERALRFAQATLGVLVEIFNSKVTLKNLEVQIYSAQASVYRDRIQAEIAKAELYRAQIEGEVAKGQVNEQLVRRYEAQLRAINILTDIYKVSVEAVVARSELNNQRIEAKRTEVQVYAERVRAYSAAWDGFKSQVEGELGNVKMAELATNRFATLTSSWQTQNEVAVARLRSEFEGESFKLQKGEADLRRYIAQIQAQSSVIDAEAKALTAESQVYSAAGQVALAQSNAQDRQLQTQIETIKADALLQIQRGQITGQLAVSRANLLLDSMKSLGAIAAQLAAASMSAVNLSANISSASNNSSACAQSFNFSGELV